MTTSLYQSVYFWQLGCRDFISYCFGLAKFKLNSLNLIFSRVFLHCISVPLLLGTYTFCWSKLFSLPTLWHSYVSPISIYFHLFYSTASHLLYWNFAFTGRCNYIFTYQKLGPFYIYWELYLVTKKRDNKILGSIAIHTSILMTTCVCCAFLL